MTICTESVYFESALAPGLREELILEVRRRLVIQPRSLAPWMFYDDDGSRLFERITTLPQYYPSRTERGILARRADAIIAAVLAATPQPLRVLDLGAGSATRTSILLEAAVRAQADVIYMPVDVSSDALSVACQSVESTLPKVRTEPIILNHVMHPPKLEPFDGTTLLLYLGSSIGNFSPGEAREILRNLGCQLQAGDAFVLGTDLVKNISTLVSAYNDDEGVTAAFNLNILRRLNKELGADFDLDSFQHRAQWNLAESRIEMHLESLHDQDVYIAATGLELNFVKGETIHTENSCKFTDEVVAALLEDSGLQIESTWKDERDWYAVTLSRPCKSDAQL
jgi:L-histidine Nalpha-methyltransferase